MSGFREQLKFGLSTRNAFSELAINADEALKNLDLVPEDFQALNLIGSEQPEGIGDAFQTLSRLSSNALEKTSSIFSETAQYDAVQKKIFRPGQAFLGGNIAINGKLGAKYISYFSLDELDANNNFNRLSVSTSRVSSWSKFSKAGGSLNAVLYGDDVQITSTKNLTSNPAKLVTGTIKSVKPVRKRLYESSEIATHKLKVNINGTDYFMYAMKNLPLQFRGVFSRINDKNTDNQVSYNSGSGAAFKINSGASISFGVIRHIDEENESTEVDDQGDVQNDSKFVSSDGKNFFGESRDGAILPHFISTEGARDRTLEVYVPSNDILSLDIVGLGIDALPNAKLRNLTVVNLRGNSFTQMPDFTKFAPALIKLDMQDSDFDSEIETIDALINKIPNTVTHLSLRDCLDDYRLKMFDSSDSPNFDGATEGNTDIDLFKNRFPNLVSINIRFCKISGDTPAIVAATESINYTNNDFRHLSEETLKPGGANNALQFFNVQGNPLSAKTTSSYYTANTFPQIRNIEINSTKLGVPNLRNAANLKIFRADSTSNDGTFNGINRLLDNRYTFFTDMRDKETYKFKVCNNLESIDIDAGAPFGPFPAFVDNFNLSSLKFGTSDSYTSLMLNTRSLHVDAFTLAHTGGGGEYVAVGEEDSAASDSPRSPLYSDDSPHNVRKLWARVDQAYYFLYNDSTNQWELRHSQGSVGTPGDVVVESSTVENLKREGDETNYGGTLFPWAAKWPTATFSNFRDTSDSTAVVLDLKALPSDIFTAAVDTNLATPVCEIKSFSYVFNRPTFEASAYHNRPAQDFRNEIDISTFNNDKITKLENFKYRSQFVTAGKLPYFPYATNIKDITVSNNSFTGGAATNGDFLVHSAGAATLEKFDASDNSLAHALDLNNSFGEDSSVFSSLKTINLSNNKFTEIKDNIPGAKFPALEELTLNNTFNHSTGLNPSKTIVPNFNNLPNLRTLNLEGNTFDTFSSSNLFGGTFSTKPQGSSNIAIFLNNNKFNKNSIVPLIRSLDNLATTAVQNPQYLASIKKLKVVVTPDDGQAIDIQTTSQIDRDFIELNDIMFKLTKSSGLFQFNVLGITFQKYPALPDAPTLSFSLDSDAGEGEYNESTNDDGIITETGGFDVRYHRAASLNNVKVKINWERIQRAVLVTEDSPDTAPITFNYVFDLDDDGTFEGSPEKQTTIDIASPTATSQTIQIPISGANSIFAGKTASQIANGILVLVEVNGNNIRGAGSVGSIVFIVRDSSAI